MNAQAKYIESHTQHIEQFQKFIDESAWIPEIPDEWNARVYGVYGYPQCAITLPFNRALYPVVKEYFEGLGWELVKDNTDESKLTEWSDFWTTMTFAPAGEKYDYSSKHIEVRFNPDVPGSICRRKVIGIVTKKESVYEFACE